MMKLRTKYKTFKHKFNATKVKTATGTFDSKIESKFNDFLKQQIKEGTVLFFLRQVPIHLPGGTKLVVDFLVFYATGEVEFIDVKGIETTEFKIKKREVEALYPFEIKIVKKGDF